MTLCAIYLCNYSVNINLFQNKKFKKESGVTWLESHVRRSPVGAVGKKAGWRQAIRSSYKKSGRDGRGLDGSRRSRDLRPQADWRDF